MSPFADRDFLAATRRKAIEVCSLWRRQLQPLVSVQHIRVYNHLLYCLAAIRIKCKSVRSFIVATRREEIEARELQTLTSPGLAIALLCFLDVFLFLLFENYAFLISKTC